jgi:hypothetical protein
MKRRLLVAIVAALGAVAATVPVVHQATAEANKQTVIVACKETCWTIIDT